MVVGVGENLEWMKQEPDMTLLVLIKYTDCEGNIKRFNLIREIQNDCKDLGTVLGIEEETLNSFGKISEAEECTFILQKWIQRGKIRYEVTWDGLLEALEDAWLGGIANHLKKALVFHADMDSLTPQYCKWCIVVVLYDCQLVVVT